MRRYAVRCAPRDPHELVGIAEKNAVHRCLQAPRVPKNICPSVNAVAPPGAAGLCVQPCDFAQGPCATVLWRKMLKDEPAPVEKRTRRHSETLPEESALPASMRGFASGDWGTISLNGLLARLMSQMSALRILPCQHVAPKLSPAIRGRNATCQRSATSSGPLRFEEQCWRP